jgi:glycogen debranching enzyme
VTHITSVGELQLKPRESWQLCVDVMCMVDGKTVEPGQRCGSFGSPGPKMPMALEQWLADAPRLETDSDTVRHTYHKSLIDLAALRFRPDDMVTWSLPAAGLPWFMALFGRDSLITSYQALPFQAHLAKTTLEALSAVQETGMNDFRDAEPGMRRYGFSSEAATLALSIFEAAEAFAYRLPEVFAGLAREESGMAVEYPSASRAADVVGGRPAARLPYDAGPGCGGRRSSLRATCPRPAWSASARFLRRALNQPPEQTALPSADKASNAGIGGQLLNTDPVRRVDVDGRAELT